MIALLRQIETAAHANSASSVAAVELYVGALAGISPERLRERFDSAKMGTLAEGAELRIRVSDDRRSPHARDVLIESIEVGLPEGMS
jgi:Zn finger protein HypA/HybF involved in hydrogenase expression